MVEITVKLPENVARSLGDNPDAMAKALLENAAIEGYRAGRFSHRQVGEMLGLDYWQTDSFLAENGVPLNYTSADLDADSRTLDKILGGK
jgi:predicted HTH domain antitoxin